MALLTKAAEEKVLGLLLQEGLADISTVYEVKKELGKGDDKPILDELIRRGAITDDMVAHATAMIIGVPYVELRNIIIDQDILNKIPYEAQIRVMAIPLGEKDGMLNVAMADVTNVQATDYLSNL